MTRKLKLPSVEYLLQRYRKEVFTSNVMSTDNPDAVSEKGTSGEKPKKFGPRPDFSSLNFDFVKELDKLSFPIKSGES